MVFLQNFKQSTDLVGDLTASYKLESKGQGRAEKQLGPSNLEKHQWYSGLVWFRIAQLGKELLDLLRIVSSGVHPSTQSTTLVETSL